MSDDQNQMPDGTTAHPLWNTPGHKLVALMAQEILVQKSSPVINKLRDLIAQDTLGRTSIDDLAFWPDTIKRTSEWAHTSGWHFIDIAFHDTDPMTSPALPKAPNVVSAIADQIDAFNKAVQSPNKLDALNALAFVIHLTGDLHQPLHCATRVSDAHPQGDKGGNDFAIYGPTAKDDAGRSARLKELHALWDAGLNLRATEPGAQRAVQLVKDHPPDRFRERLAVTDMTKWALESYALARTAVYADLVEKADSPPAPTEQYLQRLLSVAEDQGLVAAYRLAAILEKLAW